MEHRLEEQLTAIIRDHFGIHPKSKAGYRKSYPEYFDQLPYPNHFRVPDFAKFTDDDATSTMKHIGRFLAQCGKGANQDKLRVRLFPLSLSGSAFTWFTTMPPNSVNTWAELETKFHDYFSNGSLELRISDLTSVSQKFNKPVVNYIRRFREVRNRCYSVALPDA